MNYATLLGYTLLLGVAWGFRKLARILDAYEARMGERIDAAVVEQIVVGDLDPAVLREVCDRVRERAGRG